MLPLKWFPDSVLPDSSAPFHGWVLSWLIPFIVILVIIFYYIFVTIKKRRLLNEKISEKAGILIPKIIIVILGVSAVLSICNYYDYGVFRYGTFLNEWDVYHYYTGTKYHKELGYNDQYGATAAAQFEFDNKTDTKIKFRDLSTYRQKSVSAKTLNFKKYKDKFSKKRWDEFVSDINWFKTQFPKKRWELLFKDAGYNGTPAWSFVVGNLLTKHISIQKTSGRFLLLSLDPLLMLAGLVFIAWAFGIRTSLIVVIFLGTHYLLSWGELKGGLLRTDFTVFTLISVSLLKKGYSKTAGAVFAWAIISRVFPVLFLIGPAVRFIYIAAVEKRMEKELFSFFWMCGLVVVIIITGSVIYAGSFDLWNQWILKISHHNAISWDWNIGYQALFDVDIKNGLPSPVNAQSLLKEEPGLLLYRNITLWAIRFALIVPGVYFAKFLKNYESFLYSFIFIFLIISAGYYYYLILTVPLIFFADKLENSLYSAGTIYMFLTGIMGYIFFSRWHQEFPTYYYMSWMIMGIVVLMLVTGASNAKRLYKHR
ncbi:MAG: hypothetical protein JXR91_04635 [Deltaproteobacteria bacterium]|nr:hypothetical protein [Deltaproteobacteria bacterium]